MKKHIKHALIALLLITTAALFNAKAQTNDALPTLRGDEAIEKLKETGQYDSLRDAFNASRLKDGDANEPQTEDAIGQNVKLLASDAASNENFGRSVAIDGSTAVVGAFQEDTSPTTNNGAAYVFIRNGTGWTEQAKLLASDRATGDRFGVSVAISGNTIIVGAEAENTSPNVDNGAAYIFVRSGTTWTEQQKLLASDPATDDFFGWSVAISGETVIVGVYQEDTAPNTNNGAAYIFIRSGTTWTEQQKLLASDPASNDAFGSSVGISGETVVIGAQFESTAPNTANGAAYIFVRSGTTWTQQQKLLASDAASAEALGFSVGISGETVIVGAPDEDTSPNSNQGAAYIFVRSGTTWSEQAKLLASDASTSDLFGNSVSISGDTAVVGAFGEDTAPNSDNGAVYVFTRSGTTWSEQAKLLASDSATSDFFGIGVAISGENLIAGVRDEDTAPNTGNGAAFIFRVLGNTWTQEARKAASDGAAGENFGWSVAISGDTAVVGANLEDTGANNDIGAAYIYVRSGTTWTEQQKLSASDAAPNDQFGYSVGISGDTVIVGAWQEDSGANTDNGAAYIYVRSGTTWTEQAKLLASDAASTDNFGRSVAISGDTAIVGAFLEDTAPNADNGAAYIFVRSGVTWTEQQKLLASDAVSSDLFGWSVAIDGNTAIVGAYQEDTTPNSNQGAAYIFVRSGTTWTEQAKLLASDRASNDQFGFSVGISGETVIVAANVEDTAPNTNNGAAYIFVRSGTTWTQQAKLLASDAASSDLFGYSVGISGDAVVVGAYLESTAPNAANGAAYVFVREGTVWTEQAKLLANDAVTNDRFGTSVAISGDKIVVGSPLSDVGTSSPFGGNASKGNLVPQAADQGGAYFFVNGLAPTAANVSVSGRVLTSSGAGVRNALVTLTKPNGETVGVWTGTFGYYRFDDIAAGQPVVISVISKRFAFTPQIVTANDDLTDVDFIALE